MARNRVQYIVSADSEEAVRAVEKFLLKEKEAGVQSDRLKEQGKGAFDGIGESVVSLGTKMLAGLGAYEAIQGALDLVREKAAALREEMERTAEANLRHVDSFTTVMQNMSSASAEEVKLVGDSLLDIAGQSGIDDPVRRINEAFATVQSTIPNAGTQEKLDIVREAVQSVELEGQGNVADIALGIGAIWAGAGGALTPNQAQNLMRAQQEQGRIKEVGPLAQMQGPLLGMLGELEEGGTGLKPEEIMGLSAATTQALSDPTGERTRTLLSNLVGKLMVAGEEFKEKTGVELSGTLLDRLRQIHEGLLSGEITPEEMKNARPGIGLEGAEGATFQRNMLQSRTGFAAIHTAIDFIGAPERLVGDSVAASIADAEEVLPGYKEQLTLRRRLAALEAGRARDVYRTGKETGSQGLVAELEREERGQTVIDIAASTYRSLIDAGASPEEAEKIASGTALRFAGETPLLGGLVKGTSEYIEGSEVGGKLEQAALAEQRLVNALKDVFNPDTWGLWFKNAVEQGMRSALQSQGGRVRPVPDQ